MLTYAVQLHLQKILTYVVSLEVMQEKGVPKARLETSIAKALRFLYPSYPFLY